MTFFDVLELKTY